MTEPANADQIKFWNGPGGQKWAAHQSDMDRNLADVTAALLPFAAAKPGERVLDIGCGAGQTSHLLAAAIGPTGHVTGVDISAPLLANARARAATNETFIEADAAFHAFKPEFDLIFSRFGVMFFDDPPSAFANIRKGLKPGGRLAFVCWRPAQENEWVTVPALAARPFLPPQPPPDPLAPGPFAFADSARVEKILSAAGFRDVQTKKLDGVMNLGASSDEAAFQMTNLGPLSRALGEVEDEAVKARVRAAVKVALEAIRKDGVIKPAIACWLVAAAN
jgi:SAM-dependent methyltransferase